jgi:predicted nucleic acid-binding protein
MITLDASVWIASLDKKDPRYGESVKFLGQVVSHSIPLFAPSFALVEVACALEPV